MSEYLRGLKDAHKAANYVYEYDNYQAQTFSLNNYGEPEKRVFLNGCRLGSMRSLQEIEKLIKQASTNNTEGQNAKEKDY